MKIKEKFTAEFFNNLMIPVNGEIFLLKYGNRTCSQLAENGSLESLADYINSITDWSDFKVKEVREVSSGTPSKIVANNTFSKTNEVHYFSDDSRTVHELGLCRLLMKSILN